MSSETFLAWDDDAIRLAGASALRVVLVEAQSALRLSDDRVANLEHTLAKNAALLTGVKKESIELHAQLTTREERVSELEHELLHAQEAAVRAAQWRASERVDVDEILGNEAELEAEAKRSMDAARSSRRRAATEQRYRERVASGGLPHQTSPAFSVPAAAAPAATEVLEARAGRRIATARAEVSERERDQALAELAELRSWAESAMRDSADAASQFTSEANELNETIVALRAQIASHEDAGSPPRLARISTASEDEEEEEEEEDLGALVAEMAAEESRKREVEGRRLQQLGLVTAFAAERSAFEVQLREAQETVSPPSTPAAMKAQRAELRRTAAALVVAGANVDALESAAARAEEHRHELEHDLGASRDANTLLEHRIAELSRCRSATDEVAVAVEQEASAAARVREQTVRGQLAALKRQMSRREAELQKELGDVEAAHDDALCSVAEHQRELAAAARERVSVQAEMESARAQADAAAASASAAEARRVATINVVLEELARTTNAKMLALEEENAALLSSRVSNGPISTEGGSKKARVGGSRLEAALARMRSAVVTHAVDHHLLLSASKTCCSDNAVLITLCRGVRDEHSVLGNDEHSVGSAKSRSASAETLCTVPSGGGVIDAAVATAATAETLRIAVPPTSATPRASPVPTMLTPQTLQSSPTSAAAPAPAVAVTVKVTDDGGPRAASSSAGNSSAGVTTPLAATRVAAASADAAPRRPQWQYRNFAQKPVAVRESCDPHSARSGEEVDPNERVLISERVDIADARANSSASSSSSSSSISRNDTTAGSSPTPFTPARGGGGLVMLRLANGKGWVPDRARNGTVLLRPTSWKPRGGGKAGLPRVGGVGFGSPAATVMLKQPTTLLALSASKKSTRRTTPSSRRKRGIGGGRKTVFG